MTHHTPNTSNGRRAATAASIGTALSLALVGCGGGTSSVSGTTSASGSESSTKLIVAMLGFPCGLNSFATQVCAGFEAAGKELPEGYTLQVKTGTDYSDNTGYNNLIRTSLQLQPAGIIVFPGGSAAQTTVLKQACDDDVEVIIIDTPVDGVDCQSSFIGADHAQLGTDIGGWLVDNPPSTKQVGVVSLPPGQTPSNDARVQGFTDAVEEAGYEVVATAVTDLSLDKTRTEVTNMLTAHPDISAVFSANDAMGDGAAQAIDNPGITQVSIDGSLTSVERIKSGTLAADIAQDPFGVGELSVQTMAEALQGASVKPEVYSDSLIVDKSNVDDYLANGGIKR